MSFDVLSGFELEAQRALARAQRLARARRHFNVQPIHLLASILETPQSRGFELLVASKVSLEDLRRRVEERLSAVEPTDGEIRLGKRLLDVVSRSLDEANQLEEQRADTDHMVIALAGSRSPVRDIFEREGLRRDTLARLAVRRSGRTGRAETGEPGADPGEPGEALGEVSEDPLARFGRDITEIAEAGQLDPVVGRTQELRRMVQILCRRSKNNPVLLGEPGVGRSTLVEGLAQLICAGKVPSALSDVRIVALDLGGVVAGAKFRGEFEERLRAILTQIKESGGRVLVFIDEIHTLVGAGRSGGGGLDAASLLKPALARGELRCIGSTTPEEYRLHLEKDKALVRRFEPLRVKEPDELEALAILRGLRRRFELHHGVRIGDEALLAAVRLSRRYVGERCLPDKAIDVLDEAASRLRVELEGEPDELADLDVERARLRLVATSGGDGQEAAEAERELAALEERRDEMVSRWHVELDLVTESQQVRQKIQDAEHLHKLAVDRGDLEEAARVAHGELPKLQKELEEVEGRLSDPRLAPRLLSDLVTSSEVAQVIAIWTGIPVDEMLASERERLRAMEEILSQRVKGQNEAIDLVSAAIRRARVGLKDPKRPIGSFLFLGPTGVGKTELAKALAEFLFHSESAIIRLDMSEFMEKQAASRLVGAPPGYVGYESGGQLTEAVRRAPYSIVLFDEVEKAHIEVFDLLLQVLEDGRLTDSWGRTVDMSNTVIVMTSNTGARDILEHAGNGEAIRRAVREELKKTFRPEFLNRIDETVIFNPLGKPQLHEIAGLLLGEVEQLVREKGLAIEVGDGVVDGLVEAGWDPAYGARPLRRAVQRLVTDPLARYLIDRDPPAGKAVELVWNDGGAEVLTREAGRRTEPSS